MQTDPRTRSYLPALVGAVLAIALYAVTIGGTYIYDDLDIVVGDDRIAQPSQWGRIWFESYNYNADNLYRPLVSMSYALQWGLHGDAPWAFHLFNVLLHAIVTAIFAEFVRRMLSMRAAIVAAVLFAAHPLHVEAVANIVGRAELLCATGILGAMVLFLRPMTIARALAIGGCFLLAILSKETGMLLPLLLLILFLVRRTFPCANPGYPSPARPWSEQKNGIMLLIILLCWILVGVIVLREELLGLRFWWDKAFLDWTINPMVANATHPHGGSVGWDRLLMPLALLGRYTSLLVFPVKLSPDYGAGVIGWTVPAGDPYLWMGILAVIAWFGVLVLAIRKRSGAGVFAALCLAITYGLIGNLVIIIGTNFGERLMYLPSAFFIMLIVIAATRLPGAWLVGLTAIALVLMSIRTESYAVRWNDRLSFLETSVAEQPKSIRLIIQLTEEYLAQGRLDDAARLAQQGTDILPEYWEIWIERAQVAYRRQKYDDAIAYLRTAAAIRPGPKVQGWMKKVLDAKAATQPG